ncbi:hypothetical protein J6590_099886, partial [Homalodisca vitripennis]
MRRRSRHFHRRTLHKNLIRVLEELLIRSYRVVKDDLICFWRNSDGHGADGLGGPGVPTAAQGGEPAGATAVGVVEAA